MKRIDTLKLGIVLLLLLPALGLGAGKLKGKIADSQSKDPLIGANILLVGTSIGTVSDIYGAFQLPVVPPGSYTVRCSYIGYQTKEAKVTIADNTTGEVNFALIAEVVQGQEVVISAQAFGQSAAINQQVSSKAIMNVISEQKIKELPDANAAEAIGRLPGVSLVRSGGEASKIVLRGLGENMTTITVDGVKLSPTDIDSRGIDLSTISQGSLSGIELSKAVTSDMEGEAIAGNVNFVTKIAPDKREMELTATGSYGAMEKTTKQYNFVGRYGERFFDDKLGVQVFGNIEKKNRSSEQYNLGYETDRTTNLPLGTSGALTRRYLLNNFSLTYTPEERERRGAKLLFDFKTPDDGILKLNGEINRTERRLSTATRNFPTLGGDVGYDFRGQDINTTIKNVALQGKNHLLDWEVDWSASYSESSTEVPHDYSMHFSEASTFDANHNVTSGMRLPLPDDLLTSGEYEKIIPYAVTNPMATYVNRAEARTNNGLDFEKTLFLNAKREYILFDANGEFKFGGKHRTKFHRRASTLSQAMYYNGTGFYSSVKNADGTVSLKDYAKYGFTNIVKNGGLILFPNFLGGSRNIYGKYMFSTLTSPELARNWYDMTINGFDPTSKLNEYDVDNSEQGSDYNLQESVTSGYIMNTLSFGSMATLIAGVRVESDNNDYTAHVAKQEVTQYSTYADSTTNHKETIVLPNVQMIIKPTDFLNVRLAAYRGVNRPDFNTRLPAYYYGFAKAGFGDSWKVVKAGSTNIVNADAWNFEANTQFYGNGIGLFSVSAFYKKINNLVSTINYLNIRDKVTLDSLGVRILPGTSLANLLVFIPYNSQSPTKVWGFEIEHQANLRWLPGLLSNIVLSYNLTISRTETFSTAQIVTTDSVFDDIFETYIKTTKSSIAERKGPIPNAPELFGNLSLGYDIAGFSGRVSYFYQRKYYTSLSIDDRMNYLQKSFNRVDLSLKQELTNNISIGLNVNNITNAGEGVIQRDGLQDWERETSDYKYGTTGDLWLKISL